MAVALKLANGTEITAETHEELAKKLATGFDQLNSAYQTSLTTKPEPTPVPDNVYNKDKFVSTFIDRPDEGLDYLLKTRYGISPTEFAGMKTQIEELQKIREVQEAQLFIQSTPGYQVGPESAKVMTAVLDEYGLPNTSQGLKAAYKLAVTDGKLKPKDERVSMPHSSGRGGDDLGADLSAQVLDAASLDDEKLEALYNKMRQLNRAAV
jgi:hypothetical protein